MPEQFVSVPPPLTQTAVQDAIAVLPQELMRRVTSVYAEPGDPNGVPWQIAMTPKPGVGGEWPPKFGVIPIRYNER